MSVSELPIPHQDPTRTPPQDVAAEQSVIGAMLLSKDAIADVVEQVREHDFYRPNHQTLFSTVIDFFSNLITLNFLPSICLFSVIPSL